MLPREGFDWQAFIRQQGYTGNCAQYADTEQRDERFICYEGALRTNGHLQSSQSVTDAGNKLVTGITQQEITSFPWQLLAGIDMNQPDRGELICACFEVGEKQILAAHCRWGKFHKSTGRTTNCGTNCGSCIPELNKLINETLNVDAA